MQGKKNNNNEARWWYSDALGLPCSLKSADCGERDGFSQECDTDWTIPRTSCMLLEGPPLFSQLEFSGCSAQNQEYKRAEGV